MTTTFDTDRRKHAAEMDALWAAEGMRRPTYWGADAPMVGGAPGRRVEIRQRRRDEEGGFTFGRRVFYNGRDLGPAPHRVSPEGYWIDMAWKETETLALVLRAEDADAIEHEHALTD